MLSLLDDVAVAPVDAFLTAVEKAMNSNTFLLKVRVDEQIRRGNCTQVLDRFIHAPLFTQMIRHADLERGWGNLQEDSPVIDGTVLEVRELSEADFVGRLRWMLREAFSPYERHCSEQHTDELIHGFLGWLHAEDSSEPVHRGSWSYADVRPMFLRSTGYYAGTSLPCEAAYFDGGASDTATLFYRGSILLLLLTNGSP